MLTRNLLLDCGPPKKKQKITIFRGGIYYYAANINHYLPTKEFISDSAQWRQGLQRYRSGRHFWESERRLSWLMCRSWYPLTQFGCRRSLALLKIWWLHSQGQRTCHSKCLYVCVQGTTVPGNLPLSPAPLLAGVLLRNFTWKHQCFQCHQNRALHGGSQHPKFHNSVSASNALLEAPNQTATDLEDEHQHSVLCLLGLLPYMTEGSRNIQKLHSERIAGKQNYNLDNAQTRHLQSRSS